MPCGRNPIGQQCIFWISTQAVVRMVDTCTQSCFPRLCSGVCATLWMLPSNTWKSLLCCQRSRTSPVVYHASKTTRKLFPIGKGRSDVPCGFELPSDFQHEQKVGWTQGAHGNEIEVGTCGWTSTNGALECGHRSECFLHISGQNDPFVSYAWVCHHPFEWWCHVCGGRIDGTRAECPTSRRKVWSVVSLLSLGVVRCLKKQLPRERSLTSMFGNPQTIHSLGLWTLYCLASTEVDWDPIQLCNAICYCHSRWLSWMTLELPWRIKHALLRTLVWMQICLVWIDVPTCWIASSIRQYWLQKNTSRRCKRLPPVSWGTFWSMPGIWIRTQCVLWIGLGPRVSFNSGKHC